MDISKNKEEALKKIADIIKKDPRGRGVTKREVVMVSEKFNVDERFVRESAIELYRALNRDGSLNSAMKRMLGKEEKEEEGVKEEKATNTNPLEKAKEELRDKVAEKGVLSAFQIREIADAHNVQPSSLRKYYRDNFCHNNSSYNDKSLQYKYKNEVKTLEDAPEAKKEVMELFFFKVNELSALRLSKIANEHKVTYEELKNYLKENYPYWQERKREIRTVEEAEEFINSEI